MYYFTDDVQGFRTKIIIGDLVQKCDVFQRSILTSLSTIHEAQVKVEIKRAHVTRLGN